jgi:hypothetical protein
MKFKIGVASIILSTAAAIGLIHLVVNKALPTETLRTKKEKDRGYTHDRVAKAPVKASASEEMFKATTDDKDPEYEPEPEQDWHQPSNDVPHEAKSHHENHDFDLNKEDEEKIIRIARLSEAELAKEIEALRARIEKEDLFAKLENGNLSLEKEAKEALERFALLGLEGTRRKYLDIEPHLKDPLSAHRESLKEIRKLLNE